MSYKNQVPSNETEKKWRLILTATNREKNVSRSLYRKNIQAFCPLSLYSFDDPSGRVVTENKPLFPSIIFTRIFESEMAEVLKTKGVLNFLFWQDSPVLISEEDIATIYNFSLAYTDILVMKFRITEKESPEVSNDTMRVLLPTLGYMMVAQKDKRRHNFAFSVINGNEKKPAFSF